MKILLDTHVWLWVNFAPKKLGRSVARAIDDDRNERWLSPISIWELGNLARADRVRLDMGFDDWVARSLRRMPCKEAPMTFEVALETRGVSLSHHEPADRIIAASARVFGLTLVTADEALLAAHNVPTMAAN